MNTLLAIVLLLSAPLNVAPKPSPYTENLLTQYSTIDALLAGVYDGNLSVAELKQNADFGLGTFNGLDGELLMFDGVVYQLPAEGKVNVAPDEALIPFVTMCTFKSTQHAKLEGPATKEQVEDSIEQRMFKVENIFYAVKFEGTFSQIKARSPHKQQRPYPPIKTIIDEQSVFNFENIEGTMIGFWCPKYLSGINVGGWHMHFISKDKTQGGHVLDYAIGDIDISCMELMRFEVLLPRQSEYFNADLNLDRKRVIEEVESGQGNES